MARRKKPHAVLRCPDCRGDGYIRIDYVGVKSSGSRTWRVPPTRQTSIPREWWPCVASPALGCSAATNHFARPKDAGRDICDPDVRSFMLAVRIAQDESLSYPARGLGMLLLLVCRSSSPRWTDCSMNSPLAGSRTTSVEC
jgi:hypothetical protein